MLYMASVPQTESEDSEPEPKRVDAAEFYKPMRGVEIG